MFLLYRIKARIIFWSKEQIAPGELGGNGATTMHLSYFDLFLAFLGLTFGLPSALPGLFFQSKDGRHPRS
ncbi:hypothetical protein UP06_01740 [Bradyrhizobium sp. LTSP857]|nr:hypothetical protein UP06_01740 [Bradyrhizobium sp. LTSP857]